MKKLIVYRNAFLSQESGSTGDFDACVVMDRRYKKNEASYMDLFEVMRGNKIKTDIFNAKLYKQYELKEGMEFGRSLYNPPNQAWTIYAHNIGKDKVLGFLKYTWNNDAFKQYLLEIPDKPINTAYDFNHFDIDCHPGAKVFNRSDWTIESNNRAVWDCRLSTNGMKLEALRKYFGLISKNIEVKSVDYVVNNGGFHNYTTRGYDLYDCKVVVELKKVSNDSVSIEDIKKELRCDKHFVEDNKIYLVSDDDSPNAKIIHLKDNVIDKVSQQQYRYHGELLGKKIS